MPHDGNIADFEDFADAAAKLKATTAAAADTRPPEYSDDALALRFVDRLGDDLRYVALWSQWLRYAGGTWRKDGTLSVIDSARGICREAAEEVSTNKRNKRIVAALRNAKTVYAVEKLSRSDRRVAATPEQWDMNDDGFSLDSMVLETLTGTVRESRRDDYCTKHAGTHLDEKMPIPLWNNFLDRITAGNADLQSYLQRVCGYCLTGLTSEHVLFFLYGNGANGKSTFIETIAGIFGDYTVSAPMETFVEGKFDRHPTEIAGLHGARLVIASEIESGRNWNETRIKILTGGDTISARFMRADFFEFTPKFKLMISGNHKPSLRSVTEAIRRRIHLIPFTVTIPPEIRDRTLAEKLKAEWPGIMAWAVRGCMEWRKTGLLPPRAVLDATDEYLKSEDALGLWIEERCVVGPACESPSAILYSSWTIWAEGAGEKPGSQRWFSEALIDRGFRFAKVKGKRGISGIEVRDRE